MNARLRRLFWRMTSPLVATRLTKEELCLSMAAVARLGLRHEEIADVQSDAIATRAQRLSQLCIPTELGMLANGAAALFCRRIDLADALISGLYTAIHKGLPTRISHVTTVLSYTAGLGEYRCETARALLISSPGLLHKNDSTDVLEPFLRHVHTHLTGEEFCAVVDELQKRASKDQSKCIDATVSTLKLREKEAREVVPRVEKDGHNDDDDDGNESRLWTALRAREWMSKWVRNDVAWTPSDAVQSLELYSHFGVHDVVLLERIQDVVVSVVPVATKGHMDKMRKIVLAYSHLFPRVREVLSRAIDEPTQSSGEDSGSNLSCVSSVARTFRTTQAYERLLLGRRVPEEWMFELMQEQDGTASVDMAAQAACIFAERGEIPEGIIVQISTQLDDLSPHGIAAFFRAMWRDSLGVLLPHAEAVVRLFALKGVREATVETLLQVCATFALPIPRGAPVENYTLLKEGQSGTLRENLITRLLSVVQDSSMISHLCEVVKATCAIDKEDEVVQLVCLRVSARKNLTTDDALALFNMLCCRSYVYEPLLDIMEPLLSASVELVIAQIKEGSEVPTAEARRVAAFASLQADFDAPEFDTIASMLLHALQQYMDHTPVEVLPAAGLLSLRCRRKTLISSVLDRVYEKVHELSDEGVGEFARLLTQVGSSASKELVAKFLTVVTSRLAQQHALAPDAVGLAVVAHWRCADAGDVVDELVYDYLLEWMGALSSGVYTALCCTVHLAPSAESLMHGLLDDLPRRLDLLSTGEIVQAIFGLGEVAGIGQRLSHQLVAEKCSDYVIDHSHEFWSGKDIARLLYGFSRMHCTKRSLYNVFATRLSLRPILVPMDQEAISLVVGAFGRSKYLDKKLFDALSRRILEQSKEMQAPDLLLTISGFSRVMLLNTQLYHELGCRAAERVNDFPLESQCSMLASFGSLGIEHDKLATKMLDSIVEKIPQLECANRAVDVIVSLWQMNYEVQGDARVARLADWVIEKSEELTDGSIGKLCAVLNDTNWRHVPLAKAIADQSTRLHVQQRISAVCCRAVLDTLGSFMIHHQGARENLSSLGRSVSKERIQLSEEEEQQVQLLLKR